MEQNETRAAASSPIDMDRIIEIFEYEMTEVLVGLKESVAAAAEQNRVCTEAARQISERAEIAPISADTVVEIRLTAADVPPMDKTTLDVPAFPACAMEFSSVSLPDVPTMPEMQGAPAMPALAVLEVGIPDTIVPTAYPTPQMPAPTPLGVPIPDIAITAPLSAPVLPIPGTPSAPIPDTSCVVSFCASRSSAPTALNVSIPDVATLDAYHAPAIPAPTALATGLPDAVVPAAYHAPDLSEPSAQGIAIPNTACFVPLHTPRLLLSAVLDAPIPDTAISAEFTAQEAPALVALRPLFPDTAVAAVASAPASSVTMTMEKPDLPPHRVPHIPTPNGMVASVHEAHDEALRAAMELPVPGAAEMAPLTASATTVCKVTPPCLPSFDITVPPFFGAETSHIQPKQAPPAPDIDITPPNLAEWAEKITETL